MSGRTGQVQGGQQGAQQGGGFYLDQRTGQMMQGGTLGGYGGGSSQWVGGRTVAGFGQPAAPQWTPQAPFKQNPFIAAQLAQTGLEPSQSVTNAFNAKMGKISQNSAPTTGAAGRLGSK